MEENSSLFSLSIEPANKSNLLETAKWAKFLAIVGFIFVGLFLLVGVVLAVNANRYSGDDYGYGRNISTTMGMSGAFVYFVMSVIAFFPALFTLRFANAMKNALYANDQLQLNTSFQNLKIYFRYLGIITIIMLVLIGLSLFIAVIGGSMR